MPAFDARSVGGLRGTHLAATGYRNQARGFDPRSGDGARRLGGRFNPPHSFPVLYLCLTRPCVFAELSRQAERQSLNVEDLLPREVWAMRFELTTVLDLTDEDTLTQLSVSNDDLVRTAHAFTQQIGEAAYEHHFQAIRSPSATGVDHVLAVFPENLADALFEVEMIGVWTNADDLPRS